MEIPDIICAAADAAATAAVQIKFFFVIFILNFMVYPFRLQKIPTKSSHFEKSYHIPLFFSSFWVII